MATEKLNVLLVIIDDLRTELGSYTNGTVGFTPNIDAFAKKSVQFNRAYTQVSLCAPSRMSLFSGRTARSLDYFQQDLADVADYDILSRSPIPSMPKYFEAQGYSTAAAGKVFHRADTTVTEFQSTKISASDTCPCNSALNTCPMMLCSVTEAKKTTLTDYEMLTWGLSEMSALAKAGKPFYMSLGIRKPHLPYYVPITHIDKITSIFGSNLEDMPIPNPKTRLDPYSVANYWCSGMDDYLASTANAMAATGSAKSKSALRSSGNMRYYDPEVEAMLFTDDNETMTDDRRRLDSSTISTNLGADPVSDDLIKQMKLGYFAAVSWTDELFGMIDAKLTSLKLYDNTVVVLVGDNGFNLGEQGQYCKNNNFEAGTKVPLYIRHPTGSVNIKRQDIVTLLDLYPTLLDLAMPGQRESDTNINSNLQGNSFADLIQQSVESKPIKTVFSELQDVAYSGIYRCYDADAIKMIDCTLTTDVNVIGYSVRTQNFRYTEWRSAGQTPATRYNFSSSTLIYRELYDHSDDSNFATVAGVEEYYIEFDNMENQNIMDYLEANESQRVALSIPRAVVENGDNYMHHLVNVVANMLSSEFSCANQNCIPITELLPPSNSPTSTPSISPHSPTHQPIPTHVPTSHITTESPVFQSTTLFPTGSPIFGVSQTTTGSPTIPSISYTSSTEIGPGMAAAITILIILVCVTIAALVTLYVKFANQQQRVKGRLPKRESDQ